MLYISEKKKKAFKFMEKHKTNKMKLKKNTSGKLKRKISETILKNDFIFCMKIGKQKLINVILLRSRYYIKKRT